MDHMSQLSFVNVKRSQKAFKPSNFTEHTHRGEYILLSCVCISPCTRVPGSISLYVCVCVWRLWSLSVCKIAVVLRARARTSRETGESEGERKRQTEWKTPNALFLLYSLRWDDSSIERFTSITLLDLNEQESQLFLFKSQTFTLLTSLPSKDKQRDKETTHTYALRDHTHNHTNSFITVHYGRLCVFVCDLKQI